MATTKIPGFKFIGMICDRLGISDPKVYAVTIRADVRGCVEIDIHSRASHDDAAAIIESLGEPADPPPSDDEMPEPDEVVEAPC